MGGSERLGDDRINEASQTGQFNQQLTSRNKVSLWILVYTTFTPCFCSVEHYNQSQTKMQWPMKGTEEIRSNGQCFVQHEFMNHNQQSVDNVND